MLCEYVGWVFHPWNFLKLELIIPQPFLYPQITNSKMPYASKAPPATDTDRSRCVGLQVEMDFEAKIRREGFKSQSLRGSSHYATNLRLA